MNRKWLRVGFIVWTVLAIEGVILVFAPSIRLWLAGS